MTFSSIVFFAATAYALHIKKDESVILYPSIAKFDSGTQSWNIPVHAHVFEAEENSLFRKYIIGKMGKNIPPESGTVFNRRMHLFMIDNQRSKKIDIKIGENIYHISKTAANGQIEQTITVPAVTIKTALLSGSGTIAVKAVDPEDAETVHAEGTVYFPGTKPLFIITDIDDTIKISDVRNRKELLANTFYNQFKPVPGMPGLFRKYSSAGALILYISASPWQLYPEFKTFLSDNGFPAGVFRLKYFRMKDSDFFNLFMKGKEYKIQSIEPLLKEFPDASLILIGDSGEQDPEAYAYLAEKYPSNIRKILIRQSYQDETARCISVFKNIPKTKWQEFITSKEIQD